MKIEFNKKGAERKELVQAIEKITEKKSKYLGAPSMAYQIGEFLVTKDGAVESKDSNALELLTESLALEGILSQNLAQEEGIEAASEQGDLTVEVPREKLSDEALERLRKLVTSKATLLKKAFDTSSLPITVTDEKIAFPWFKTGDTGCGIAYSHFISAICDMAKNQKRISATEKEIVNEKYEFRCFLLRLGFIGAEFKEERKILLKNLTGSSAFKSGAKKEVSE